MFKILISLLFIFSTFTIAKDDTYVFEAKGAFAKDLKALVEKYSKEGKVQVKVYKKSDSAISSIFGGSSINVNGKALYMKKCASCHGNNGERGAGAGSRKLKDMTKDEIYTAVDMYKRDAHFGGSMKMLMHDIAVPLGDRQLNAMIDYLKGGSNTEAISSSSAQKEDSNSEQSSYLK